MRFLARIDHFWKIFNNWKKQVFLTVYLIKFSVTLGCKYCATLRVNLYLYFCFNKVDSNISNIAYQTFLYIDWGALFKL